MSNETALQIIESATKTGALIFFDKTNGFPQTELYRVEVTQINIDKDKDCFEISKKFMPKREVVDRIGEASGVLFTKGETRDITVDDPSCGKHVVYIGIAQGKRRLPDGTWRTSSVCEYEFDPTLRAMLDYQVDELNSQTKQQRKKYKDKDGVMRESTYGNNLATAIKEYQKMARARANTGARLRVIRELVSMPIAFTAQEIEQPVYFGRIVQNTSYILQTPEGRAMATAQALGVDMSSLFGKQKLLNDNSDQPENQSGNGDSAYGEDDESTIVSPPTEAVSCEPDFPDDPAETGHEKKETEFERLTHVLIEFMDGYKDALDVVSGNGKNPYKMGEEELKNPNATIESRSSMIDRLRNWLQQKGYNV